MIAFAPQVSPVCSLPCTNLKQDVRGHLPPGDLATMLHRDMVAHQKRTADFTSNWKVWQELRVLERVL